MTTTATADEAAERITEMLGTCGSRGMFTFSEIAELASFVAAKASEPVWTIAGNFLNAEQDNERIGSGKVANLLLDLLIALDRNA